MVALTHILARDSKQLGIAIARHRKLEKLTQAELADRAGVLQKTISAVERGASGTQLKTFFRLLAALNLEIAIKPRGSGGTKA